MRFSRTFPWLRRSSVDDFADAIRGELAEIPVPPADDRLLARVMESRGAGARVILPTEDPSRPRRGVLYASAVAAAAVVVMIATRSARERRDTLDIARNSWLLGDVAYAQTARADRPTYAAAVPARSDRLRPIALRYERRFTDAAGRTTAKGGLHVSLAADTIGGVSVWRATAVSMLPTGGVEGDSVWMATRTLRPLRAIAEQSPYRSYERIRVDQRMDGLRFSGEMRAWKAGAVSAHRTFDRQLDARFAPYISDAFTPLYLTTVPLARAWTGSISVLGWGVRDDNVFISIDLRVDGEDVVRVPAGEFACWRLAMTYAGRRSWYWVRKSDGVGVRTLDSSDVRTRGIRESVLLP